MFHGLFYCSCELKMCYIRITCECNIYPLIPHFYKAKMRYVGVYLFFLFLLQNIDCGYSLEPPRLGVPKINVLSTYVKNNFFFQLNFNFCFCFFFYILHGQVFVIILKHVLFLSGKEQ